MSERFFNCSLKSYNSFGLEARAVQLWCLDSLEEFEPMQKDGAPALLLSGGSNVLLLGDVPGLVLHSRLKGIRMLDRDETRVLVRAAGGEGWHEFVRHCLAEGYYGLENLALIPGTVGAAPVQNIGAYGIELAERVACVEALELSTGRMHRFSRADCEFGYRDSIFKREPRDRYLITAVEFLLDLKPSVNTRYAALANELAAAGISAPTPGDVFDAICRVRRSKLPDPAQLGNAGSFFKNPSVTEAQYLELKDCEPGLVAYPLPGAGYKLAAGWLIERCGLRGQRRGAVGVHERQSLVLVNYGGGSGQEILALAREVQERVLERFGVALEAEVRLVGSVT
ncbi:MAG: UDP-N-acetylmuramate dehydrogenase [Gammaproteobacteria bacterium]|nr:UDP-N-acetylmuramate dehydrogenase [Gammaproteobacteria bacterium]